MGRVYFVMLFFRKKLTLFEAITTLVGAVIGAGVLGIPYAVAQVGFVPGMIMLVVLTYAIILRHLMIGEVALRTPGKHQMIGYFERYFGKRVKYFMTGAFFVGMYGSMLAYIIGVGRVLYAIFGGSSILFSLLFAVGAAGLIYTGLNIVKRSEFILTLAIFGIIVVIFLLGWSQLHVPDLGVGDLSEASIPYGVILFALAGSAAIPEIRQELQKNEILMKRALVWGTVIPAIIYFIFTFFTLGVNGGYVTEIATVGLGSVLGRPMVIVGNLFAFFAMGTSMLTIGLAVRDMFFFDYKIKKVNAWLLTVVPTIVLFLFAHTGFTRILNWIGGVLGGVISIATIFMYWRARKQGGRDPEYVLGPMVLTGSLLIVMYLVGIWQVL